MPGRASTISPGRRGAPVCEAQRGNQAMKIGMITDSLGGLDFAELIRSAAELGIETLEFACGNWAPAPHIQLDAMLESETLRKDFMGRIRDYGLAVSALNCSGN